MAADAALEEGSQAGPADPEVRGAGGERAELIRAKGVGERRLLILRDLGAGGAGARTAQEACARAAETLSRHAQDIPFALLYLIDADRRQARLAGYSGMVAGRTASLPVIDLTGDAPGVSPWPLREALGTEAPQTLTGLAVRLGDAVPPGPWTDAPQAALVLPIRSNQAHRPAGFLVAGISARLQQDQAYRDFIELVASQVATAIANAREYEAELEQARNTLEEAQRIAHLGSFEYVAATGTTLWSAEEYRIYGLDPAGPSPAYDAMLAQCIHPDDAALLHETFTQAMHNGTVYELEHRILRPDGSVRWVYDRAQPYHDENSNLLRYVGATLDITERKQAELALRDSRQQLALALEAGQLGFWDWDLRSGRVYYGGCWAAMLGYDPSEVEPHISVWERLIHPDDRAFVKASLTDHLEGRTDFYESTHRMRHQDGTWRWILDRGQVVERDADARPLRATGTHADVTARREAELALQDDARRKDEFLATLGHELRNPLAPIRNAIEALRIILEPNPAVAPLLAMMERQITHLVRLVDDLLEVSRITRGKIELRTERLDLGTVVGNAVDTSRPLIDAGRHRLEVALPAEPLLIDADPVRLTQVLANLLNNAAKYTEPGGTIRVVAERQGTAVVVSVRDTGVGISAELLPQVFDLFVQSARGMDRTQGGLGIGLALVRRLVEMHGGTVTAHSAGPGRGSEFVVRLPVPVDPS